MTAALSRSSLDAAGRPAPAAPVRIVHLGLGAFHRAHQAWYTAHATDADHWGIAALTGRAPDAAETLASQDGLYSLTERGLAGDSTEIVTSIVAAVDGADTGRLRELFALSTLAIVTTTVTERGYRLRWDGELDDDAVLHDDLHRLALSGLDSAEAQPQTVLGRLLVGFDARRRARGGPIAVVPCDNVPDNGSFLRTGLTRAAAAVAPDLVAWIDDNVAFVSTSVDRITPRLRDADAAAIAAASGFIDRAPVITEPFSDWVLEGDFPAGRPDWESAGARFVADIAPWERRKLWMLNGAHILLALAGPAAGHRTVAEAIADPRLGAAVAALWRECAAQLPPEVEAHRYADALEARFRNHRIEHSLAQIAQDATDKMRLRIVPVAEAERRAGRAATGCAFAIAAWADHAASADDTAAAIRDLSVALGEDSAFVAEVDGIRARRAERDVVSTT